LSARGHHDWPYKATYRQLELQSQYPCRKVQIV
jgi:hypothetical protein